MTKRTIMPPPVTPAEAHAMLLQHLPTRVAPLLTDAFAAQAAIAMDRLARTAHARRVQLNDLRRSRAADVLLDARRIAAALAVWCPGTPEGDAAARAAEDLALVASAWARSRATQRDGLYGAGSPDAELRRGLALLVLGLPGVSKREAASFVAATAPVLGASHVTVEAIANEWAKPSSSGPS